VLDLLFAVVFAGRQALETRFLLLAQATELYHRQRFPGGQLDPDEHAERVTTILDSVPSAHREWLEAELEYSNEPSLRHRLKRLTKYADLSPYGVLSSGFVWKASTSRNYYTHYSYKLKDKAAKGARLYWLSEELRILLTACLLHDLGFDEDETWARLQGTRLARSLMHQRHASR
jgi:hypothetical protein